MKTSNIVASVCALSLFLTVTAHAYPSAPPVAPHGSRYVTPFIGGIQVSCTDAFGTPVVLVSNHLLTDVGMATFENGAPVIYMNPYVLMQLPEALQRFWYGHECAHHRLGPGEEAADCWSVRKGRDQGWLTRADLDTMAVYMTGNRGDSTHLPGPQRVAQMRACFDAP